MLPSIARLGVDTFSVSNNDNNENNNNNVVDANANSTATTIAGSWWCSTCNRMHTNNDGDGCPEWKC